jgi:hypothetical protein
MSIVNPTQFGPLRSASRSPGGVQIVASTPTGDHENVSYSITGGPPLRMGEMRKDFPSHAAALDHIEKEGMTLRQPSHDEKGAMADRAERWDRTL